MQAVLLQNLKIFTGGGRTGWTDRFRVLTQRGGLRDVAEVIHDIDLKDNKFNRSEAAGVKAVISGLADLLKDDRKLIQQVLPLFDGLYKLLSQTELSENGKTASDKRASGRKTKRLNNPGESE